VIAELVRAHDHYVPGRHAHEPPEFARGPSEFASDAERGPIIGAFCYCTLIGGGNTRVVSMNMDEIGRHEAVAKTKKIWQGPFRGSMILKTVVHEEYKWVAKSPEFRQQLERATAALGESTLGVLTPASPIEVEQVPSLKVRAIEPGNGGNSTPQRRQGRGVQEIMRRFETIGCTDADEQLRVVQAIIPGYQQGDRLDEIAAGPVIAQLQQFIDDADDAGDGDEFEGRTPYDVLRDWLNSPGDDEGVRTDGAEE